MESIKQRSSKGPVETVVKEKKPGWTFGLYGKLLLKNDLGNNCLQFTTNQMKNVRQTYKTLCTGEKKQQTSSSTHHVHCDTWWWQLHAEGRLIFSRDREAGDSGRNVGCYKRHEAGLGLHLSPSQWSNQNTDLNGVYKFGLSGLTEQEVCCKEQRAGSLDVQSPKTLGYVVERWY